MHKQTITVISKKVNMGIELLHDFSLFSAAHIFLVNQMSFTQSTLSVCFHLGPTQQRAFSDVTQQKPLYLVPVLCGLVLFLFLSSRQLKPQGRKDCLTWPRLCGLSLQICQFPLCFSSGPFHFPLGQRKKEMKGFGVFVKHSFNAFWSI